VESVIHTKELVIFGDNFPFDDTALALVKYYKVFYVVKQGIRFT
jgi:hypothetical protein